MTAIVGAGRKIGLSPRASSAATRGEDGIWRAGAAPRLDLEAPGARWPSGLVLFSGRLARRGDDFSARLFVESRLRPGQWLEQEIPVSLKGTVQELIELPDEVARVQFQPMGGAGEFELHDLSVRKVRWPEAFVRRWRRVIHVLKTRPKQRLRQAGLFWYSPLLHLRKSYDLANGFRGFTPIVAYEKWQEENMALTRRDLRLIREDAARWEAGPRFSLVVLVHGAEPAPLRATLDSVRRQLYPPARTVVYAPAGDVPAVRALAEASAGVSVCPWPDATPGAGVPSRTPPPGPRDWGLVLPAGAELAEHALYWLAHEARSSAAAKVIYCDHDALAATGRFVDPEFKPDWSPELLRSSNYIGCAAALRADWASDALGALGGAWPQPLARCVAGGGQHDLLLRCTEGLSPREILHLPVVLLHLPVADANPIDGGNATAALAVEAHLRRLGVRADVTPTSHGHLRVRYALPAEPPLVSIVVPTRDAVRHLRACVESVLSRSTYRRFELLVVDNRSAEPEALEYLERLQGRPGVRLLRHEQPFNYSAINNHAAAQARGEVLCLLNNDTEVITPDWLEEMLSHLIQPGVGVVGAKLYFSDGRVQHAGDAVGPGGCANHLHSLLARDAPGYCGRAVQTQDLSAVTGACLMTWRRLFVELGGLDAVHLPVSFNDVDYCLRVREAGQRVVWTPFAELYHHESVTRGQDDSPEKSARMKSEVAYMRERWKRVMSHDPFYSPNLSYERPDFSLNHAPLIVRPWRRRA